jgi:hypothetical protein
MVLNQMDDRSELNSSYTTRKGYECQVDKLRTDAVRRDYGVIHQWPTQIRHDASDAGKDPVFRIATAAVNPFRSAGDAGVVFKYANRVWMKTPGA